MKTKIILLIVIIFLLNINTTYCYPQVDNKILKQHIDSNSYEQAMTVIENLSSVEYSYNKNLITQVLENYKYIVANKINNHIQNEQFTTAINLIESTEKYYNDYFLQLKNQLQNKLLHKNIIPYTGEILHLNFANLIAYPQSALQKNNPMNKQYDETRTTPIEFTNILTQLYNDNYVIISPYSLFKTSYNNTKINTIYLPKNKKPLLLSFSNLSYGQTKKSASLVDKIIVDKYDNLATYTTKRNLNERISYENDFILIIENFISTYPSFSYNNARGIIAISGENGILGYKTKSNNATNKSEKEKAYKVVTMLKNLGWVFANNGYKNTDCTTDSITFENSYNSFSTHTQDVIGKTDIYMINQDIDYLNNFDNTAQNLKFLKQKGYKLFLYKDNLISNFGIKNVSNQSLLLCSYYKINGSTLRSNQILNNYFNTNDIYDHINRITPYISNI